MAMTRTEMDVTLLAMLRTDTNALAQVQVHPLVSLSVVMASSSAMTRPVTMETQMMAMDVLETVRLKRQVGLAVELNSILRPA